MSDLVCQSNEAQHQACSEGFPSRLLVTMGLKAAAYLTPKTCLLAWSLVLHLSKPAADDPAGTINID